MSHDIGTNEKPRLGIGGASAGNFPTNSGGGTAQLYTQPARVVNTPEEIARQAVDRGEYHRAAAAYYRERAARWLESAHLSPWHAARYFERVDAAAWHEKLAAKHEQIETTIEGAAAS